MSTEPSHGMVHLSINSSYFCNFSCKTCYLTPAQLKDRALLPLEELDRRISEIKEAGYQPGHADIYGGEILLYPAGYIQEMKVLLHSHGIDELELITNLSTYKPEIVEDPDFGISVSYDFEFRQSHNTVLGNLLKLERDFTVLTLATPEIITKGADAMAMELSMLSRMMAWEIKPYSPNQANNLLVPHSDFEDLIRDVIESPFRGQYEFLNESMLERAIEYERNSFSDDHVYITPSGRFGVLEFDLNDNEYFLELDSFEAYLNWTVVEKARVMENPYCGNCAYLGKCLSEHLREVKTLEQSCNGYVRLIEWFDQRSRSL